MREDDLKLKQKCIPYVLERDLLCIAEVNEDFAFAHKVIKLCFDVLSLDLEKRALYIRSKIPPFDYGPYPPHDNTRRIQNQVIHYENGNRYEGETD